MKKAFIAIGSVAAMSIALTGCSGSTTGGALGSGDSLVVITSQAPWNPAYDAVVKAYEEETGVDVDLRPFPNADVKTQVLNDAQTGNHTFDVYQVNEVDLAQLNDSGILMPFTEAKAGYTLDPEIFTYNNVTNWNSETRSFSADGDVTSLPLMGNLQVLMYRTDIYDDLGLSVPTTWDETIANGQAMIDADAARYGYVQRYQGIPGAPGVTYDFAGLLHGVGGSFFVDEGSDWTPAFNTPEALEAARDFRELAKLGPADPKAVGQAEAIAAMQGGDAGQLDVVAAAASSMNDESSSNVVGKVGYAVLPGAASASGLWNLALPADLPEDRRELAVDFIDWVTSEHGMEIFAEAGGIPTRDDAYDAEGLSAETSAYLDVVRESAPTAVGPFRFTFITEFLTVSEPIIAAIAAGDVSPEDGMAQLQEQVTQVVEDAGYPMG
ncbi:ABC transporter substrate-binding protein [Salinibacterium sp. UTAS2018]|uniref:ABC transporter substrate-binding protein n=1 Tax=Salinibacterium sp. UTAS2018 TaxID=2508880 RepID=UPI00143D049C|nr:extracellular solute-binding protein [Salinibacterium sp. UTAS2018]